ncbi:YveK family protein [Thermoflexus sp.]|uniref:YveK family protein n=1 Tax=Thermoflexus sp. TaxID=1969742 RepID=UPI0025E210AA|nr:Wzz/FepE/Etk N-terminal domain-containing protein [Thermoflexus sp.]MCS6963045.1 Wzz/FepE/Etk N-terminal domain-containing protein [Thermoflexus sp.]MCX7690818.1 Wzz/FepE/Etk N-terminal domain-containing protein [Thermoflexus sp.]MDW8185375.1 Wzz/FepE/Etk N-terminal domain-containing protein [Anaerolineae bacterium]
MSLQDLVWILRRWGWLIPILAVVTALSAFVYSRLQTPLYRAVAIIAVQPARPDFGQSQAAKTLLSSYVQIMSSAYGGGDLHQPSANRVIQTLQLDMTPEQLRRNTIFSADERSLLIELEVRSSDPETAQRIARTWAELFVEWRRTENQTLRQEDQIDALLVDQPVAGRFRPQTTFNVAAGAVMGLVLGGTLALLVGWMELGAARATEQWLLFQYYLRLLRRRGWALIVLPVAAAILAFVYSRLQTPMYRAVATIAVQPARPDFGQSQAAKTLLNSYLQILSSVYGGDDPAQPSARRVIQDLGLTIAPEQLRRNISLSLDERSMVIRLEVRAPDGELARQIAKRWAQQFVEWRQKENEKLRREDRIDALLVDEPTYARFRPQTRLNVALGGLAGLLLGLIVLFFEEGVENLRRWMEAPPAPRRREEIPEALP